MKDEKDKKVVARFAPSPTGFLHMGSVRTALFNFLFARKNGGKLILRVEDTDKERSKKEFEKGITDGLAWLGLSFDEFHRQSDRGEIYKKHLESLVSEGKAYVSKEKDAGEGERSEVIRFKNPGKKVKFADLIRGEIEFDTSELGDFVIAKSFDEPVFHFAVVVDDFEMAVTHIIRGEDHISNTPRQILIQEALGAPTPVYAHLPLVLAADRSKLSKRKHGEMVSLEYYKKLGYLPEAIMNFLALIGWNPGTEQEIFSLKELVAAFDISKIQKGGAIFSPEKLDWINKEHIKKMDKKELLSEFEKRFSNSPKISDSALVKDKKFLEKILPIVLDRTNKWKDMDDLISAGELDYFFAEPVFEVSALLWKDEKDQSKAREKLSAVLEKISSLSEKDFESSEKIKMAVWDYATEKGRGTVLWPMRFALSGKEKSPDPFTLASILGKKETEKRLQNAIKKLT